VQGIPCLGLVRAGAAAASPAGFSRQTASTEPAALGSWASRARAPADSGLALAPTRVLSTERTSPRTSPARSHWRTSSVKKAT
jgi:hypothetical protein